MSKIYLVLLAALTLFSCRKDQSSDPTTTPVIGPFEVVNSYTIDVQGFVTTPDGLPIENALIIVEDQQVRTTEAGTFYIEKLVAPESGLFLLAESEGFFKGGTSVYSHSNNLYTANIVLIPFNELISFDAGQGVEYVNDEGAKLNIEANTIIDNNGNAYSGPVDAYMYWIDPTAENMPNLSPGPLVGLEENEMRSLRSYGMIGVEMYGSAGQELNIADGEMASLSFPVPSDIQADAPTEIDLWHFNETSGLWDLDGVATLINGSYEASVPHFSWWNCDIPSALGLVCFSLVNESGRAIGNLNLTAICEGFGVATAWIDESGTYCNLVPVGQEITISISSFCGEVLLTEVISSVEDGETVTLEISLAASSTQEVNISGVVTCGTSEVVSNGFVVMTIGTVSYLDYLDDQGNYSLDLITCADNSYDVIITAFDLEGLTNGAEQITVFDQDLSLNIDGCNEDLGTETMVIVAGMASSNHAICEANVSSAEVTIIAKDNEENGDYVILGIDGFGLGVFGGNLFGSLIGTVQEEAGLVQVIVTSYSDIPGEKIAGTFEWGQINGSFIATVQ